MPDYGEILAFLAANPPHLDAERELHASLLELLAHCLRSEQTVVEDPEGDDEDPGDILHVLAVRHARRGRLN